MSVIPKPPTVPKPKSVAKSNDAATAEHEAILRRVWRNLDGIVDVLFSKAPEDFSDTAAQKVEVYLRSCAHASKDAAELANSHGADRRATEMRALADRLSKLRRDSVPPFPAELAKATIENRTLEQPLVEWKVSAGNKKAIEVGYVDIECQISIPKRPELHANLPNFLDDGSTLGSVRALRKHFSDGVSLEKIRAPLQKPEWVMEDKRVTIWIDVRVTASALGQLVRELKTLRNFGEGGVYVFVVMPTVDRETAQLLRNENFLALDCEWLSQQGFA